MISADVVCDSISEGKMMSTEISLLRTNGFRDSLTAQRRLLLDTAIRYVRDGRDGTNAAASCTPSGPSMQLRSHITPVASPSVGRAQ